MSENSPKEVQEEVKNHEALLTKNRDLISRLKHLQEELATSQKALEASKNESSTWRTKWHESAVIAPFDASLEGAASGPVKYLRAELLERGILKMELDEKGIERPAWYKDGEKVTPEDFREFIADIADPVLDSMIRGSGASGSGATSSPSSYWASAPVPSEPAKTAPPAFGLR